MKNYYNRLIDKALLDWKKDPDHKSLLIRGARQVGKSSAVRHLGESFDYFLEVNLERDKETKALFGDNLDVKKICTVLSAIYNVPVVPGKTLLFIDEIQESERAISALRFFYEDFPELHVVAAGSLLEFALRELPSFGVGRIRSLFMYPFSFDEFLEADGNPQLVSYKNKMSDVDNPLPTPLHTKLIEALRSYFLVGGMPEAVRSWVVDHDFLKCSQIHNDILETYQDDFSKYKSRISPLILNNTLKSIALQAGSKFVYSQVETTTNSTSVKEALQLLTLAGLSIPVIHTAANGIPLGADINPKFQKFLFVDIGLMQTLLGLEAKDILLSSENDFVNKGGLSEMFVGLEMIKYSSPTARPYCYYWQRDGKEGQAEVDYVISRGNKIVPIEVKAGVKGSMQSMYYFIKQKSCEYGIRTSLEPFSKYEKVQVIPLYAIKKVIS